MKPKNIFIIRHGQSEGNINKSIYSSTPDYALYLTETGVKQAQECGKKLYSQLYGGFAVYHSSFFRARQTMEIALKEIDRKPFFIREDPRLREQDWGNFRSDQITQKLEEYRDNYGHFYYRFDNGESCSDVYLRISDFIGSLHRDLEKIDFPENLVIFGHGMTNRLFLMRWFHSSVEKFEKWANPKNCEIWQMKLNEGDKYDLVSELREHKLKHNWKYEF